MVDFLLDETGDLLLTDNGDFVLGESTTQHQSLLLQCAKGDFKENPLSGVGLAGFLKDEDPTALLTEIKSQFEKDGMTVTSVAIDADGKLNINASY